MTNIEFFKKQAKLLLKDWQNREQKHFGFNVKELFRLYDVNPHEQPTLMKAQHLLAQALGRKNWSELINDSDESLEYTKSAFIENIKEENYLMNSNPLKQSIALTGPPSEGQPYSNTQKSKPLKLPGSRILTICGKT